MALFAQLVGKEAAGIPNVLPIAEPVTTADILPLEDTMLVADNLDVEDGVAAVAAAKEAHTAGKMLTEAAASAKVEYQKALWRAPWLEGYLG